jgi:hypothetical protein
VRLYNKDASVDLSGASHNLSAEVATKRSRDVEVIVVYEHAKLGPDAWTWANFTVGRVRVTTPSRTFHIRFAQGAQVLVLKAVAPEFMGNENGWSVGFTTTFRSTPATSLLRRYVGPTPRRGIKRLFGVRQINLRLPRAPSPTSLAPCCCLVG